MNHKEAREKFNVWWSQLGRREQQMLMIGSVAVAFFILYASIWLPIQNHLEDMRTSIVRDQKTLRWMQSAEQELRSMDNHSKQQAASITPVALLSIVQKTVEEAGLTPSLTQSKQTSSDTISLNFQKTDFDRLIALLIIILKEYNVRVTQFTVNAINAPGLVNADITLKIG